MSLIDDLLSESSSSAVKKETKSDWLDQVIADLNSTSKKLQEENIDFEIPSLFEDESDAHHRNDPGE